MVKRLGTSLKMIETSKVTEDADGGVLSFDQVSDAGLGRRVERRARRRRNGRFQPRPDPALPSAAARRARPGSGSALDAAVPLKPGQPFSFDTFDTDYPQAVVVESGHGRGPGNARRSRREARRCGNSPARPASCPGSSPPRGSMTKATMSRSSTVLPGFGDHARIRHRPRRVHEAARGRGDFRRHAHPSPARAHPRRTISARPFTA